MDKSNSSDTPTSTIHSKVNHFVMPTLQKTIRNETLSTGLHTFDELDSVDLPEYVQVHNQVLSFPEKLMLMLTHVDRVYSKEGKKGLETSPISWYHGGKAVVIRDKKDFASKWLPLFFRQAKFKSFTRKLYRWGFRQVHVPAHVRQHNRDVVIFGNDSFQRDNKGLLSSMRSVTAAGVRREQAAKSAKLERQRGFAALQSNDLNNLLARQVLGSQEASRSAELPTLTGLMNNSARLALGGDFQALLPNPTSTALEALGHSALKQQQLQEQLLAQQRLKQQIHPVSAALGMLLAKKTTAMEILANINLTSQLQQLSGLQQTSDLNLTPSQLAGAIGAVRNSQLLLQQQQQQQSRLQETLQTSPEQAQLGEVVQTMLRQAAPQT